VGLGAAVMYLFDPEVGEKRRGHIRHTTSHAAGSALGMVADEAHALSSKAKSLASSLSGAAAHEAEHLANQTRQLGSYAGHLAGQLWTGATSMVSDHAQHAQDSAKGYARKAALAARHALGEPEPHSPIARWTGITAGAVGALAIGAGLMFLLDPIQGRIRRERLRDKANVYANRGSRYVQETAHHLVDRVRGHADHDGSPADQPAATVDPSVSYQAPPSM